MAQIGGNTGQCDTGRSIPVDLSIAVIPFTIRENRLTVALRYGDDEQLPRMLAGTIATTEGLSDAAARIASVQLGANPDYIEQLYTFSVSTLTVEVIVAYFALVSAGTYARLPGQRSLSFFPADDLPRLPEVERGIIEYARLRLRAKLGYSNIGFYLLQREFTLSELQDVYEIVIGQPLDKRNFRRRILAAGIVEPVGATRASSHRPAALYRFAGSDPATDALTPLETDWRPSP